LKLTGAIVLDMGRIPATLGACARVLTGLCITVAACSGGTGPAELHSVLFTNALGFDYAALAFDQTAPARLDTVLVVPNGAQVCLRLPSARLSVNDVVELDSVDEFGNLLGTADIRPRFESWTWDGTASHATVAPTC
jgi:hypothetical protein